MKIIAQGRIAGVDWQLQRRSESGVSMSGPAALFFFVLRRTGGEWTRPRPFDDTTVPEGGWEATVEREAHLRVARLLAFADTVKSEERAG